MVTLGEKRDRPGQGLVLAQGVDGQLGGHRLGERRQSPQEPEESPAQDRPAVRPHMLEQQAPGRPLAARRPGVSPASALDSTGSAIARVRAP